MDRVGPFDTSSLTVPYGSLAAWVNAAPQNGVEGSVPSVEAWIHSIEEIVSTIEAGGQSPDHTKLNQLLKSVRGGNLFTFTDQGTAANSIVIAPATPHTSLFKNLRFRIWPNFTNTAASVVIAVGMVGTAQLYGNLLRRDGSPLAKGDVLALAPTDVVYDGANFRLVNPGFCEVQQVVASAVVYVSPTGNDAAADGTQGAPFATPEAAHRFAASRFASGSGTVTIQIANGTYPAPAAALSAPAASIVWQGNPANPGAVIVQGTGPQIGGGGSVVGVSSGRVAFNGLTIYNTGGNAYNNHVIGGSTGAGVTITNVFLKADTGSAGGFVTSATGANVVIGSGCSIAGSMAYGFNALPGGTVVQSGVVNLIGTPNFTQTFANALQGTVQCTAGAGFAGTATGTKYYAAACGVINTNGAGTTYFPGNSTGSVNAQTYGVYL